MADSKQHYANLIYQGKQSSDFGIMIKYPFNVVHAVPDMEPIHIEGRSGDFLQTTNGYQNVTETFDCIVHRPADTTQFDWDREVIDWLSAPIVHERKQYQYLQFDIDPEYAYKAVLQNPPTFTWDENSLDIATGSIPFDCEPYQYRLDGINYVSLPDNGVVYNTESRNAIPNWHFIADGSFTLVVNNVPYQFDNMEGEFWLNGDTGDTYDGASKLYNDQTSFPNLAPPVLKPGKNTITITAEKDVIRKAQYMPRWRRLI